MNEKLREFATNKTVLCVALGMNIGMALWGLSVGAPGLVLLGAGSSAFLCVGLLRTVDDI
jgi:hypothetical protein